MKKRKAKLRHGDLVTGFWAEDPKEAMRAGRSPEFYVKKYVSGNIIHGVLIDADINDKQFLTI